MVTLLRVLERTSHEGRKLATVDRFTLFMSFMNYKQSLYERKHEADMLAECSRPKSFDQSRNVMYTLSCEGVKVKTREGKSKKAYPCPKTKLDGPA